MHETREVALVIDSFLKRQSQPNHRFNSWFHCYNYFDTNHLDNPDAIDLGCLHLAFYLASWGMYRGSSFLLSKDYKIHKSAIELIMNDEFKELKDIAALEYNDKKIELLFRLISELKRAYGQNIPSITLITKILLGTLACVPAYDRFLIAGLNKETDLKRNSKLNHKNFELLLSFCENQNEVFKKIASDNNCPYMKIVDMYLWGIGEEHN